MPGFMEEVKSCIEKHNMIKEGDGVVVGVSGGADSLCLLHVLLQLSEQYKLKLYGVHLNHMFRGIDADRDAEFVGEICTKWGIPSFVEVFDVPAYIKKTGMSPEEAGREIRYRLFEDIRQRVNADKIAVAQNLNDNTETILMRFMRGTGIDGLKGIEPVRGRIIRPLLELDRSRIEDYCKANGLEPREDKTNLETIYSRNKIRLELIPFIKENFNPNINAALQRFASVIKDEAEFLELQAEAFFMENAKVEERAVSFSIAKLAECHQAIKRRIIRKALLKVNASLTGFEQKHIEGITELLSKSTGAAVELPQRIRAYISYVELIISKVVEKADKKCLYALKDDSTISIDTHNKMVTVERKSISDFVPSRSKDIVFIDASKIKQQLVIRNREEGDRFSPIGMKGSKKLKEYFIDEKVPKDKRDEALLVADGSEIVWVVGSRISEKYKITSETTAVIAIRIINLQ